MADHLSPGFDGSISGEKTPARTESPPSREKGLRSLRGIRWLLLAGALVSAVSLYRLVEAQWELMPVAAQYLVLIAAALGLYGTGELAHRRLHLPLAGSALLLLFTALIPVLSWGAAYLGLLADPFGWVAFALGTFALLAAARRSMSLMLSYRGLLYPAILAIFMLAQPILPELAARNPGQTGVIYLAAAFVLGVLLQLGSRHINRFFFHRDRKDGVDRPIHWMPFLVLSILYFGALILLEPRSELMALPLVVIGMVLADTGEEYHRALISSQGKRSERWPKRSLALMTIGIAAIVIALPVSFLDSSLRCPALVSICAAVFFGRWSVRSPGFGSQSAALGSVFAAYHLFPALVPNLAKELWARLLHILDLTQGSPLAISIADLGFLLILIAWSGLLRRTGASDRLRAAHAGLTVVYLWWLSALAVLDPTDPSLFLALLAFVGLIALVVSRRSELVLGLAGTAAALVLAVARLLMGEDQLLTGATMIALGITTIVLILTNRWVERPLAKMLAIDQRRARRLLVLPAAVVAGFIASHSLVVDLLRHDLGGLELLVAGGLFLGTGLRLNNRALPVAGGILASIGLHVLIFDQTGALTQALVLMTQALAVLSLWAAVRAAGSAGRVAVLLRPTAFVLAVFHCLLGLWWLLLGIAGWDLTAEPLILMILGLLAADVGLTTRTRNQVVVGGLLLTVFAMVQFAAIADLHRAEVAIPSVLTAVAIMVMLLIAVATGSARQWTQRRYALDDAEFQRLVPAALHLVADLWATTSIVVCLFFCGPVTMGLALSILAVVFFSRVGLQHRRRIREALSMRLLLVLLVQVVMTIIGSGETVLPLALVTHGFDLLPLMAMMVFGWRLVGLTLNKQTTLVGWTTAVELGLACFIAAAAITQPGLTTVSDLTVVAVALSLAVLRVVAGAADPRALHSWMTQIWIAFAVLHGFTAGWLRFDGAAAPWALLAVAIAEYGIATALSRTRLGPFFGPTCRLVALGVPLLAWGVAVLRTADVDVASVWPAALPAFAVSLFFAVIALREDRTTGAGLAASVTFGWTLLAVVIHSGLGFEFYFLAPGLALMGLAYLLRPRVGETWSLRLATAGAAFLYATPIVALSEQVSWIWLAILLVMTVVIGSACVALRSRSLLLVSTAAMLTDLGFFVFKIGTTEPLLLWVFGLAFGLALIASAGYLEYQREGLLQQVRVFGRELRSWR